MRNSVLAAVVLGVLVFVYLKYEDAALDAPAQNAPGLDSPSANEAKPVVRLEKIPPVNPATQSQDETAETGQAGSMRDQDEKRTRWLAEHGYSLDNRTYYLLSAKELKELAESGDVEAIQNIAFKYVGEDTEKALATYRVAAAHGSTSALIAMADHSLTGLPDDGAGRSKAITRSLSFALAALKRGDYMIGPNKFAELKTRFAVSEEVIAHACSEAVRELAVTENVRTAIGMGYFDQPDPPRGLFNKPVTFDSVCTR